MLQRTIFSLLLLVIYSGSSAQNYQPLFGVENQTFRYLIDETAASVQEFNHIRIDSAAAIGPDNAWFFGKIAIPGPNFSFSLENEHDMGAYLVERGGGSYEFHSLATGDTIFLHTQLPLNTPWTFRSDSSITAEISQRSQLTLFGSTVDSILTISLSDGEVITLSQNHGLISFPSFSAYFRGDVRLHYSLTEPAALPRRIDYFGWQPGDVLGWYEDLFDGYITYRQVNVLAANSSPDGNTLSFELDRREVRIFAAVDTTDIRDTITFHVNDSTHPTLLLGTGEYASADTQFVTVVQRYFLDSTSQGLLTQQTQRRFRMGNFAYELPFDLQNRSDYAMHLGERRFWQEGGPTTGGYYLQRYLECYEVGFYSLLPCRDLNALLTSLQEDLSQDESLAIFPNPSQGDFVLQWEGSGRGALRVQVHDLQGRLMWSGETKAGTASQTELNTGLKSGMYVITLIAGDKPLTRKKVIVQ